MHNGDRYKFVVKVTGYGEGCDYTIGCNTHTFELPEHITTMQEAVAYVTNTVLTPESEDEDNVVVSTPRYSPDDIEAVVIYQVTQTEALDMKAVYQSYREKCKRKAEEAAREKDEREYQRLKAKLGK